MKEHIGTLLNDIGNLMQDHLTKRDFEKVTQLSVLLARGQKLHKRLMELEGEISEIETSLKADYEKGAYQTISELELHHSSEGTYDSETGRACPQTLHIEIDWKANGRQHDKERILLPKATDSMVKFLTRIVEEFGQDALQKLCRLRINRGPLLSKSPAKDFLNQSQGIVYANKPLKGTDYFILTHSETSQKISDLNRICRVLGLVPGSVQIRRVNREEYSNQMYT